MNQTQQVSVVSIACETLRFVFQESILVHWIPSVVLPRSNRWVFSWRIAGRQG